MQVGAGTLEVVTDHHFMLMLHTRPLCNYAAGGWPESASSTEGGGHSPQPLHCWRVHRHHDGHGPSAQRKGWSLSNATDVRQGHSSMQADLFSQVCVLQNWGDV